MQGNHVHGYSDREARRLFDQAETLSELLHADTLYPPGSKVLEVGCGVGAQTVILARKSPKAKITSVDASPDSIAKAKDLVRKKGVENVTFQVADVFNLPFEDESFNHVFVCFLLEHLREPKEALVCLKSVLRRGGSITVIEGDHGSAYFFPESAEASRAVGCLMELQEMSGGNSRIGRQLYPLLKKAGFENVRVSPRMVYADDSRPKWVEGFTRRTFTAMVEGVGEEVLRRGMMNPASWRKGIDGLRRTYYPDGTFCYCFFKGVAEKWK